MGTSERRYEILKTQCRNRYEKIRNLAFEFGVSKRTIQRDIEVLNGTELVYIQFGKYGGVYVVDGYSMNRMYMKDSELDSLQKLYIAADKAGSLLADDEKDLLNFLSHNIPKQSLKYERINYEKSM